MHSAEVEDEKLSISDRVMHERYKAETGLAEFAVMKGVARATQLISC